MHSSHFPIKVKFEDWEQRVYLYPQSLPLGRSFVVLETNTKDYIWEEGDTLATVAIKYSQPATAFQELQDLNLKVLQSKRWKLVAGDTIRIPDSWFPIPQFEFSTTFRGSHGYRQQGQHD